MCRVWQGPFFLSTPSQALEVYKKVKLLPGAMELVNSRAGTHTQVGLPARLLDLTVVTVLEISAPAGRWAQYKDVPG